MTKKYTATQYAKLKGVSRQAVLARIKRGTLKAKRDALSGIWVIETEE